jgi:hypothetical protein
MAAAAADGMSGFSDILARREPAIRERPHGSASMSAEDERKALLESLAALDVPTLRRLAASVAVVHEGSESDKGYLDHLRAVAESDIVGLKNAERSYGNSWKLRGGVDTFHMLRRKWERVEKRVATTIDATAAAPGASPYDVFEHVAADRGADGFIDDLRDLRRYLMLVEAETTARKAANLPDSGRGYLDQLVSIAQSDVATIEEKENAYGSSWKRAGGIGAFMMFARKWDRLKQRVAAPVADGPDAPGAARDNVFEHIAADRRSEGVIDDIRGLRQYLLLVEAEMAARGAVEIGTARDNREG